MSPVRVLIVDDHKLFRRGLRQVCEAEGGFEVVGEAENGQEAVALARRLRPDVILMDIKMPVVDGVQATRLVIEEDPEARVIMLTVFERDEYVFQALKAGACGYLLKDVDEETLVQAVRTVHGGGVLMDTHVANRMLDEFRRLISQAEALGQTDAAKVAGAEVGSIERLTNSEMEVLRLVAQGESNSSIARRLGLSEKTIANRMSAIYQKLRVNSRVQAALYALRRGWVDLHSEG